MSMNVPKLLIAGAVIGGINLKSKEADVVLTLTDVRDQPVIRRVFAPADYLGEGIDVAAGFAANADLPTILAMHHFMIVADGTTDFSFTVHRNELQKTLDVLKNDVQPAIHAKEVTGDPKVAKVSVVGIGMRSHVGIASLMFRTLSEEGINIQMISTSEIKTSVVIDEKYMELAVRALHKAFDLDQAAA